MAYALVGSRGAVATGTNSVSPSFGQATSAGNLLVAWVATAGGTIATSASGWARASAATAEAEIWYKPNSGASESAPTFTATGTMFASLAEFSGGLTASPVDKIGNISGSTSPQTATASAADTEAAELVCGANRTILSMAGTHTSSGTFNNGATESAQDNDATSTTQHYRFGFGITTGNASADTYQVSSNSMSLTSITVVVVSFKLAPTVALFPSATNFGTHAIFRPTL